MPGGIGPAFRRVAEAAIAWPLRQILRSARPAPAGPARPPGRWAA